MPLVSVTTPNPTREPIEIRVSGGEIMYTFSPNILVTTYVEQQHMTAVSSALTAAIPGAVITSRPE